MPVTPQDIEDEHDKAMEALTKEQQWALSRLQRAYQESHFNHRRISENLVRIFETEARARNDAEAARQARPAPEEPAEELGED